ncbi:MAG: glycine cleavage system protein R [Gammaproteobacteria bacterium]|nr:glycine cleavage system protein R [Gammaproteobacteria bacterium]
MQTYLVASAVGQDRPGIVYELTRVVRDAGCSVQDSRMSVLGAQLCAQFLVRGNWSAVAKLEAGLPKAANALGLTIALNRTELRTGAWFIPYSVEVVALERPGILEEITGFFATRDIGIEDLYSNCFLAAQTGTPMFSVSITIGVPEKTAIAHLRNEFLEFCDELNLDADMSVIK